MTRPNFYQLLELDWSEKDWAKIQDAITAKQKEWSRDRNHPSKGRVAQQNLGLLDEIRRMLSDPLRCEHEAQEWKQIRQAAEKTARKELDDHIEVRSAKGYIRESEIPEIAKLLKRQFTESEIRSRIHVPVLDNTRPTLDRSKLSEIDNRLGILGHKTLYEFLGTGYTAATSCAVLLDRAKEHYSQAQKNNNKTVEVTVRVELAGYCLEVFKSEDQKQRYDNSESQRTLRELEPLIHSAGSDRIIDNYELEVILRKVREAGVPVQEAKLYIIAYALEKGWLVAPAHEVPKVRPQQQRDPDPEPESKPQVKVFISYRREDSFHATARIAERLRAAFGKENVFMDVLSIPSGVDYRHLLVDKLASCDIVIAVIGLLWLGVTDDKGTFKLRKRTDPVRLEIAVTLTREIPVIPVLVDHAPLPKPDELPKSIKKLAYREALPIPNDPYFQTGLDFLEHAIEKSL